jgi:hypothetical protein
MDSRSATRCSPLCSVTSPPSTLVDLRTKRAPRGFSSSARAGCRGAAVEIVTAPPGASWTSRVLVGPGRRAMPCAHRNLGPTDALSIPPCTQASEAVLRQPHGQVDMFRQRRESRRRIVTRASAFLCAATRTEVQHMTEHQDLPSDVCEGGREDRGCLRR